MPNGESVAVCWSGGKDSCMALREILIAGRYEVAALLTTVTHQFNCISIHGVRLELAERQAEALGLRLHRVYINAGASNEEYEAAMTEALLEYHARGVRSVVFGDLFLADIKEYRDRFLARIGMQGLYPIWQRDTRELIRTFVGIGFKAVVSCVDSVVLPESFAGRIIDDQFLSSLPPGVDPCGENGEFHTFVFGGPLFKHDVRLRTGERVLRGGHYYCDLLPEEETALV